MANKMQETIFNLISAVFFALLALLGIIGVILGAWWHLATFAVCAFMAYVLYTDDDYGIESAKEFIKRIKSK